MGALFILLWLLSIVGLVVFVIKPKLFTKLFRLSLSRLKLAILFIVLFFAFGMAMGATTPPLKTTSEKTPVVKTASKPKITKPKPITPAKTVTVTKRKPTAPASPSRSTLNSEAVQNLTSATNYYANLFQQAQTALGTYQYPDATSAMSDTNWTSFSAKASSTDNSQAYIITPYNKASNLYSDNKQSVPNALDNWQYDMQQVDSDYHTWVQQGTSWLDSEITTGQLNGYTQTFQKDLTTARNDITQIK